MRDAIGFENLQDLRYLYAPHRRCTNDFTAIYVQDWIEHDSSLEGERGY